MQVKHIIQPFLVANQAKCNRIELATIMRISFVIYGRKQSYEDKKINVNSTETRD